MRWAGTAHELVLLNLLQDFEASEEKPSLLSDKLVKVGMSFKPHKKTENILQIVYIKNMANQIA